MPFKRTRMFRAPFVEFVALLLLALADDDDDRAVRLHLVAGDWDRGFVRLLSHAHECGFARLARGNLSDPGGTLLPHKRESFAVCPQAFGAITLIATKTCDESFLGQALDFRITCDMGGVGHARRL